MNRIALMLALTAGISCAAFGYEPQRHNDTFTTNGVTYAQRGGLGAADYVVTNIDASAIGKVTSVNGMDGDVVIDAKSVGAVANDANYLAVSNRAMTALQSYTETDPRFREWVASVTNEQGIISAAESAMFAYLLGGPASEVSYAAEDITAISNGFAAADETLSSRLSLASLAATNYTDEAIGAAIANTNPAFSNAVLAVGLNIDTNSVAVLNEIASTFGGFPIEGTATTVGGLLAALAAAIAWLKKNKVGSFASVGGATATVENGVAKLDDFFKESNSLLNGRLTYSRNETGIKDRAFNALTFDGTEFNLSSALEAVTPTASGQPRDLLIVATATAATTISFTAGTIKGDKPTIDGSGTWLITLTEYASGVWYCRQIKMEDAA